MRLIDADALAKAVWAEKAVVNKQGNHTDHYFVGYNNGLNVARVVEIHAPTIDPEELRPKGRWARKEDSECYWYEGSECGEKPLKRYKYDCFSSYCPNCGAKMEQFDN